jgi:hypothetical protein
MKRPATTLATPQRALPQRRKVLVIMAKTQPTILQANEVQALAERLRARGESRLLASDDNKHLSADLRLAAKVIAALTANLPGGFVVTIDDGRWAGGGGDRDG